MKKFHVTHTEKTIAKPSEIWKIWCDIAKWPEWDKGLHSCLPKGTFEAGQSFMLTPKGTTECFEVHLVDVVPHNHFVDETRLPFGTIRASHRIEKDGAQSKVTHTIEAEIAPDHAEFFERAIWSGMLGGVPQSVKNLKELAEKSK